MKILTTLVPASFLAVGVVMTCVVDVDEIAVVVVNVLMIFCKPVIVELADSGWGMFVPGIFDWGVKAPKFGKTN